MKILLVASDLSDGGGVNRVISNLTNIFCDIPNLNVELLNLDKFNGIKYPVNGKVKLVIGKRLFGGFRPLNLIANLCMLRSNGYDYVLSFWTHENILTVISFAGSNANIVLSEHFCYNQVSSLISKLRKLIYPHAHKLLVLNATELRYYQSFLRNVIRLPNPVIDTNRTALDYGLKQNLIIGVGHLIKRKGFTYLIDACAKMKIDQYGWRVVIIGEGPESQSLQDLIESYGAGNYITICSPTEHIEQWYRLAKIIVVPSLSEVFSMVLPEAMSHGVIPLAFAADGPCEILKEYPNNLIASCDSTELCTKLLEIINDENIEDKANNYMNYAFKHFSFSSLLSPWKNILV